MIVVCCSVTITSGRSRISHRGVHTLEGVRNLQHGCFLVKMYAKMKELGPMGGHAPGMPPRSANDCITIALLSFICITFMKLVEKCYMYLITQKQEILTIKIFAKLKHNCTNKAKVKNMYLNSLFILFML